MISIKVKSKNDRALEKYLKRLDSSDPLRNLDKYAQMCVEQLKAATPVDTGLTRDSWGYKIEKSGHVSVVYWTNNNFADGIPVVILLEYGHATKDGGYVMGINFVHPVMKTIYQVIADSVWKDTTK